MLTDNSTEVKSKNNYDPLVICKECGTVSVNLLGGEKGRDAVHDLALCGDFC